MHASSDNPGMLLCMKNIKAEFFHAEMWLKPSGLCDCEGVKELCDTCARPGQVQGWVSCGRSCQVLAKAEYGLLCRYWFSIRRG